MELLVLQLSLDSVVVFPEGALTLDDFELADEPAPLLPTSS